MTVLNFIGKLIKKYYKSLKRRKIFLAFFTLNTQKVIHKSNVKIFYLHHLNSCNLIKFKLFTVFLLV